MSSSVWWYHQDALPEQAKGERNRATNLQTTINKLRVALYDKREMIQFIHEAHEDAEHNYYTGRPKPVKYQPPAGDLFTVIAPLADPHIGKQVWGKEGWGEDYDTDIACERVSYLGENVRDWILRQSGRCKTIHSPNLGDFWHTIDGKTEHGTLLHQDTRAKKVISKGVEAEYDRIEKLRSACDHLHLYFSQGNHDHINLYQTSREIQEHFRACPDVTVHVTESAKSWVREGECLYYFDHGYGLSSVSTPGTQLKAWNVIQRTLSTDDTNGVERYYYMIGHLHHHEVSETVRMELIRVPSIAEPDDYEERLRVGSDPFGIAYRLDANGYIEDPHNVRLTS